MLRFKNNKTFICAFLTACYTGMRTGEIFALTWDDIDLEKKIIKINKTVYSKIKDDARSVEMVFTKNNGLYVGTDIIKYPFKIIHNELGIENCRFYDLRGSYATKILRKGAEIRDVADILGHSRIETTENYYISSSEESRKHASEIFEKSIQSSIIDEIIGKY